MIHSIFLEQCLTLSSFYARSVVEEGGSGRGRRGRGWASEGGAVEAGCCWRGNLGLEREAGGRERGAVAGGRDWRGLEREAELESEGGASEDLRAVTWGLG